MPALYHCKHCREMNSCDCSNCSKDESDHKRMIVNDDGESFKCAYCQMSSSYDESEDLGLRDYDMARHEDLDVPKYFPNNDLKLFYDENLPFGRMISGSKSIYRELNPENIVIYNANIITVEDKKIWYGDIDLTLDEEKLKRIAKAINKNLYILNESDCRYGNENDPIDQIISRAYKIIEKE